LDSAGKFEFLGTTATNKNQMLEERSRAENIQEIPTNI
jgi:hypothetical protein